MAPATSLPSGLMCTVSIIAICRGFRLVTNRDEQRDRPAANPPLWRPLPGPRETLRVIWPADRLRDGTEGGTWIAASERGLAMTILNANLNPHPPLPTRPASRGDIIPALLHLNSAHAVAAALHDMDLDPYPPFRLIAVEQPTPDEPPAIAEIRWDRRLVASAWHRPPACFASSGLGDHLVQQRIPLFHDLLAGAGDHDLPAAQDRFHAHAWPDRPQLSVLMSRAEARTVSTTTVDVVRDARTGRAQVAMNYRPIPALALANP